MLNLPIKNWIPNNENSTYQVAEFVTEESVIKNMEDIEVYKCRKCSYTTKNLYHKFRHTCSNSLQQNAKSQPGTSSGLAGPSRMESKSSFSIRRFHCPKCDSSFSKLHLVVDHWADAHYRGKLLSMSMLYIRQVHPFYVYTV